MDQEVDRISGVIVDAAMKVHTALGPGLLEHPYKEFLRHELTMRGLMTQSEVSLPVIYEGAKVDFGYRLDLLVNNVIIVELKSVRRLMPIHRAQLFTYLKLSKKPLGLLFNFNTKLLKHGIVRIAM